MRIALDMDQTLLKMDVDQKVCKKLGFKWFPPTDWSMSCYPDYVTKEIIKEFCNPDRKLMTSLKPFPGVIRALKKLKKYGHELIIVTSRMDSEIDRKFIKKTFPMIDQIEIVGINLPKLERLKELKVDMYVDDHITEDCLSELTCEMILILNKNTPYNHYMKYRVVWSEKFIYVADMIITRDKLKRVLYGN
jgi:hypothetical protein